MLKIQQLMNLTSGTVQRRASRLRLLHYKIDSHEHEAQYTAVVLGESGKPREVRMIIDEHSMAKVRCSCEHFEEGLKIQLAMHQALLGDTNIDRRNKRVRRIVPGLCAHLFKLAMLSQSAIPERNATRAIPVSAKLRGE